jgi:hypothetical protein
MAFRHLTTGHYALLRMDGLRHANLEGYLDGSWWFQSDGGGDFSGALHKGSFDGGSGSDVLLRHTSSQRQMVWMMNGSGLDSSAWVSPDLGAGWHAVGVDDFDADNRSDLVTWNETTGAVEFWLMNGSTRVGAPVALTGASPRPLEWRVTATADVNQDARPDLLWRNVATQKLEVWLMNGTAMTGVLTPSPDQAVHANWQVVALADFGGDVQPDLLWYNASSGNLALWIMDKFFQRASGTLTTPAGAGHANWKVVAAGDFGVGPGGQGCTNDVLWRNETSGRLVVWHMDLNGQRTAGLFLSPDSPSVDPDGAPTSPLDWNVVGPR